MTKTAQRRVFTRNRSTLRFMKSNVAQTRVNRFSSRQATGLVRSVEPLESRIAPAFLASITGLEATLVGDGSNETLTIVTNGAVLAHNRFTACPESG
jgi:hypothetical protein